MRVSLDGTPSTGPLPGTLQATSGLRSDTLYGRQHPSVPSPYISGSPRVPYGRSSWLDPWHSKQLAIVWGSLDSSVVHHSTCRRCRPPTSNTLKTFLYASVCREVAQVAIWTYLRGPNLGIQAMVVAWRRFKDQTIPALRSLARRQGPLPYLCAWPVHPGCRMTGHRDHNL